MDADLLISVIVPAYNDAQWLPRCITSIVNQTYRTMEIIVIDDGSTDDTGPIADQFAAQDDRIKVIHQKNSGLVKVRERGIALARGEYVGFVDGDDEIEPDMYERLLYNALQYNADISLCGMLYCFYDGRVKAVHGTGKLYSMEKKEAIRQLLDGEMIEPSLCNKLYKRALLKDSCLDESLINNEDLLRNFVLFKRAERIVFEDFCGYRYWRRPGSMSNHKDAVKIAENTLRVRQLILKNAPADNRDDALNCYIQGLVNAYKSVAGKAGPGEKNFRSHCRAELAKLYKEESGINRGLRLKSKAIVYCPFLFDRLFSIHRKRMYARIRKTAKAANAGSQTAAIEDDNK